MDYTVWQIDDSRERYAKAIDATLQERAWEKQGIETVDGRVPGMLDTWRSLWGLWVRPEFFKIGQLGVWYTLLNTLPYAPIVHFEDDALLHPDFLNEFEKRTAELPENFDYFSLFIPRNNDHMYEQPLHHYSEHLCHTYQGYGGVSIYWSEKGAENFLELVKRDGIHKQWDDQLHGYGRSGELQGFSSKPQHRDLVYITGLEQSIVQETEGYRGM